MPSFIVDIDNKPRIWNSPSGSNHGFGRDAYQANSTNKNTTPRQVQHRITSIRPCKELCGDQRTEDAKQTSEERGQAYARPSDVCGECFRCPAKHLRENIVRPKSARRQYGPERLHLPPNLKDTEKNIPLHLTQHN